MNRLALLCVVGILASGCQRGGDKAKPQKLRMGVTLHHRGQAPRHRLRYRFGKGQTLRYRMTSRRRVSGLPGPARPTMVVLSMFTEQVRGDRARLRWRVEQVQSGPPSMRGQAQWMEISDRGEITTVSRGRPRAGLAPVGRSVRQLFRAWPAEAVGPGARWTQVQRLVLAASHAGGVRADMQARYKLERVAPCGQGRCVHLAVQVTLALKHRAGRVKVTGRGTGSGRVVFDLERGRLVESHTRAEIGMRTSLQPGKVVQTISLKQSLELTR